MNPENVRYFDSFGVEHILELIRKLIGKKILNKIFILWGYFCTRFIDSMLKDKILLEYTSLFPPNEY